MQGDGKILRGGDFATVGGTTLTRLMRLNSDGSLETSFNPNFKGIAYSVAVQADEKILVGGAFTTAGVSNRNRIARLNGDGSLDTNFNPNVSSTVQGAAVQADGLILLGGNFTSVGGLNRTNVARLQNDAAKQSLTAPTANRIEWLRGGTSPEAPAVSCGFSTDSGVNWIALGGAGQLPTRGGGRVLRAVLRLQQKPRRQRDAPVSPHSSARREAHRGLEGRTAGRAETIQAAVTRGRVEHLLTSADGHVHAFYLRNI